MMNNRALLLKTAHTHARKRNSNAIGFLMMTKARGYARAAGKPALRHVSDSPAKVNDKVEEFKDSASCQPRNYVGNGLFTLDGVPVGRRKLVRCYSTVSLDNVARYTKPLI